MEIPIFDPERANQVSALHDRRYQDFLIKHGLIELAPNTQADEARESVSKIHLSSTERQIAILLCNNFGYLIPTIDVINNVWRKDKFVFIPDPPRDQTEAALGLKLWKNSQDNLRSCAWQINKRFRANSVQLSFSRWSFENSIGINKVHLRPINLILLYNLYQSDQSPLIWQDLYSAIYRDSYDYDPENSRALILTGISEIRATLKKSNSSLKIGKNDDGYYLEDTPTPENS